MVDRSDPVRNTLDTLHVDPAAREDRPYLETMLRRLGYTEAEIRRALGVAEPDETKPQVLTDDDRLIEIEYTGPGLRDFVLITPADETEFAMDNNDPFGLGTGLEAGEEVLGGGPSMEEVDALVAAASEDDWNDWGEAEGGPGKLEAVEETSTDFGGLDEGEGPKLEGAEDNPFADLPPGEEGTVPEGESPGEGLDFGEGGEVEFGSQEEVEFGAPEGEPGGDSEQVGEELAFQVGHELVEFEELRLNPAKLIERAETARRQLRKEAAARLVGGSGRMDADESGLDDGSYDALDADESDDAQVYEVEFTEDPRAPFQYEDWTLYTRDVELSEGHTQKVYFFSKGEPKAGVPASMPDGYEVAVNERTALPYLRRVRGDEDEGVHPSELDQVGRADADASSTPGRRRVRMLRVSGRNREEAERKVAQGGHDRKVIRSMPIDIRGGDRV